MTLRPKLQRAAGVTGAAAALLLCGWTAASRNPDGRPHPATLAPIMATASQGNGRPLRASEHRAPSRASRQAAVVATAAALR